MTPRTRNILLGIVGALGVLVVADTIGLIPSPGASDDAEAPAGESPRARYLNASAELARDRAILARAPEVRAALENATTAWTRLRAEMINAPTLDQAEAAFRERVLAVTKDFNLTSVNASPVRVEAAAIPAASTSGNAAAAPPVRPVALRVQFDTTRPQDAYRLIDLIENMPDLRTTVTSVSIAGPGMQQVPAQITVNITVRALASIGGAAP